MLHPTHQLKSIFQSDKPVKIVTAFNNGEAITRSQEEDTTMIMFDGMATLAISPYSDHLGRWCLASFQGKDNNVPRLMVAHNPCKGTNTRLNTGYSQQYRYFRNKGDNR